MIRYPTQNHYVSDSFFKDIFVVIQYLLTYRRKNLLSLQNDDCITCNTFTPSATTTKPIAGNWNKLIS